MELTTVVWAILAVRVVVFASVGVFLLRRTLLLRKRIEARKFSKNHTLPVIMRGIFSIQSNSESAFDHDDRVILRATREHIILVFILTFLVFLINERARLYVDARFQDRQDTPVETFKHRP